jgi:MraZ protein
MFAEKSKYFLLAGGICGTKWVVVGGAGEDSQVFPYLRLQKWEMFILTAERCSVPPALGFIGKYELKIDDKGRLTIPARFKQVLQEKYPDDEMQVVVSLSLDQNLLIQPVSVYNAMVSKYMALSDLDEATRRMKELFTGFAAEEKVDGSGRIRLDSGLRDIAGARKEVTCVGNMDAFSIWDREKWDQTQAATLKNQALLIKQVDERIRN